VPSGVDLEKFRPDSASGAAVRSDLGLPQGVAVVACAGRLQPWKGQHVFLEAAAAVARELPEARFLIIGDALFGQDPGYPQQLRDGARRLGIAERTVFTGWREDMPAVYAASDVVVHSSVEPEPFGRVIVEAMACCRPVVVARSGGAAELFEEGVSGLGYASGDAGQLAGLVVRLCRDPELRERLGRAGGEAACRDYTPAASAEALTSAVEALCGGT
jgi:glycosyltransferase involved in cell wall biosynthesis